jgi:hypothetical protein
MELQILMDRSLVAEKLATKARNSDSPRTTPAIPALSNLNGLFPLAKFINVLIS